MIMHSESFDEKSAEEKFDYIVSENGGFFSVDVEQMNGFTPILQILAQSKENIVHKEFP